MSNYPFVSCLMPTFGRLPDRRRLVEEAVESFLRQALHYPADRMELVILNDCAGQTIELPSDDWLIGVANLDPAWVRRAVVIHNTADRAPSLGEKRNRLTWLARGDILLPWDDDDISLPCRVLLSVAALYDMPRDEVQASGVGGHSLIHHYVNPGGYWFWNETPDGLGNVNGAHGLQRPGSIGYGYTASACTREAWQAVGGNPDTSHGEDAEMDRRLRSCRLGSRPGRMSADAWWYIYRWGVADHLSGNPDQNAAWRDRGSRPHHQGRYAIYPHWEWPYEQMVRRMAAVRQQIDAEADPEG